MKKKLIALGIVFMMAVTAVGCTDTASDNQETTDITTVSSDEIISATVDENGISADAGFKIDGTKLIDAKGNEFVMRGINHAYAWYAGMTVEAFQGIADTGSNTIRIVCANGLQYPETTAKNLEMLINTAKNHNMIAIVEVHDITGSDSIDDLRQVTDYWIGMQEVLAGTEAYCILNIANEWVGEWNGTTWRDGYVEAIPKLREAGIKNTIMVDSAGWGQYAQSVKDFGMEVFNSDPDKNTMFSVHMYGSAGKNQQTIEAAIKGATDQGLCIVVGEFGYNHSDGDVDEAYIMQYCNENDIGYLGWSWKGNGGGVEYLDIATLWSGSILSPDWGEVLVNGENGIKATSKICSVFDDAA